MDIFVEAQGNLFKVSVQGCRPVGGGRRGRVCHFSRGSRKRLMESVTRLRGDKVLFATLTYRDPVPGPSQVKRDLDALSKRLLRRFPGIAFHWRFGVESSGCRQYHPHLHLLIYNLKWVPHEWLERVWSELTGGNGGFVWLQLKGWREIMGYVAKYVGRVEQERSLEYMTYLTAEEWPGRFWGVVGRSNLPLDIAVVVSFGLGRWFHRLKRCGRRSWSGVNTRRYCGFTLFCDNPAQWVRLCVYLTGGL